MQDIRELRLEQKELYDKVGFVYCKVLDSNVYFTSEGFNHLIYESNGKPRNIDEQFLKLKNMCFASRVIERCKKIKETRKVKRTIGGKIKEVYQYALSHEAIPGKRIRVIIQRVGNGKYTFLSVMPERIKKTSRRTFLK